MTKRDNPLQHDLCKLGIGVNLLEGLSTINLVRSNILVINPWPILKWSKLDPKSWWSKLYAASHDIVFFAMNKYFLYGFYIEIEKIFQYFCRYIVYSLCHLVYSLLKITILKFLSDVNHQHKFELHKRKQRSFSYILQSKN